MVMLPVLALPFVTLIFGPLAVAASMMHRLGKTKWQDLT